MKRVKKRYHMSNTDNTLPPEPPETYVLDKITIEELGSVFTWAQLVIDAQMYQDAAD